MTLQEAIDQGFLVEGAPGPTESYTLEIPNPGHSADEIYVSVDGVEMTLQDAIDSIGLSGSFSSSYIGSINPGHFASEILVSVSGVEMTLQDAIDSGAFSCVPDCIGKECGDDGCGGSCGTCGANAYCSAGICACNAGWEDCNNDNICECDLSSNECSGGSCVVSCISGDYYDWTGTCADFCASKGGSAVGVGANECDDYGNCPYCDCTNSFDYFDSTGLVNVEECYDDCDCDGPSGPEDPETWFCVSFTVTMCRCSCP